MASFGSAKIQDEVLLVARILLVALFLRSGWSKLIDYPQTVSNMAHVGVPVPVLAAAVAIFMEVPAAIAIIVGAYTRPLAILFTLYTLATALIAHHFWTMTGSAQLENMINFYKNVSIMGGFLLLYIAGPGRFSMDAKFGLLGGRHSVRLE